MGTLKEVNERRKFKEELIKKIESILNVENGKWNNIEKIYQFQFGEKFDIEYIYLSEKVMLHITAQHCT
jgi:hypothetical protein